MDRSTWSFVSGVVVALALSPATSIAAPAGKAFCDARYEQIDLGSFDPFNKSAASDLNNRGHVTGNSSGSTFLWSCDKGLEDVGQFIGRPDNVGVLINDRDQIIVMAAPQYPAYSPDTLFWERGTTPVLISEQSPFYPVSFTNTGFVTYYDLLWSRATGIMPIDIGVPVVDAHLSNFGRLGGAYIDESTAEYYLFTWTQRDGVKTLGPAPADSPFPADMNDRGDLLVGDGNTAYIMDRNGQTEVLPRRPDAAYLYASRLNLSREVIGSEVATEVQPHGDRRRSFVWDRKKGYRNLNDLFDLPPGNSFEPVAINDWGWIVGNRRDFNATLLVPVPAHIRRFENLQRLQGQQLCRALDQARLHRLLCSAVH